MCHVFSQKYEMVMFGKPMLHVEYWVHRAITIFLYYTEKENESRALFSLVTCSRIPVNEMNYYYFIFLYRQDTQNDSSLLNKQLFTSTPTDLPSTSEKIGIQRNQRFHGFGAGI